MVTGMPRVTVHMVASLDFFIASKDGNVSWLESSDSYENGVTGEDPEEFLETIDCYVMGSRTYEHALKLGWPYGNKPAYVLTHRELPNERPSVMFYSGDVAGLVNSLLKHGHRNIWVVGGAVVAGEFLRRNLADDIRLAIVPVMLGDGTRFVEPTGKALELHLKDVTTYRDGMVELWYEIRKQPH